MSIYFNRRQQKHTTTNNPGASLPLRCLRTTTAAARSSAETSTTKFTRLSSLGCPPAQSRGANTLPAFTGGRGAWLKTPKDGSDRVARADQHRTDTGQPVAAPLSSLAKAHGARRRDQQRPRAPKEFQPNPPTTTAAAAADERKKTGQREDERLPFSRPRHFFRRSTDAHLTKK